MSAQPDFVFDDHGDDWMALADAVGVNAADQPINLQLTPQASEFFGVSPIHPCLRRLLSDSSIDRILSLWTRTQGGGGRR